MKFRSILGLFVLMIGASACVGNLDFVLPRQDGTWDVDKYIAVTVVNNDTLFNTTYDNAGTLIFEKDGTGTANLDVPNNRQEDQAITWSFDKDLAILTINWQDGGDPWEFEVIDNELDYLQVRRTTSQTIFGAENINIREMQLRKE